ncbi:MAG: sulfur carrier protein ThiS [Deltaproteobacteria bacterium]|jgi:sulfur carrier protein|nr:sulfur carrier protein ThiS [Deltaproteobacteria bacterium]
MKQATEINLMVNGEKRRCAAGLTLRAYLEEMGFVPVGVAAELNGIVLKAADFGAHVLKDGDELEVIRFMGGG